MQERITTPNKGSITSVQAVYVPAIDLTEPAPASNLAHPGCATTGVERIDRLKRAFILRV